ncbi:MAG: ribonuclease R [Synergistetes bacterium]|nr:ribonuclease R [Synergistota bacterium]MCX8127393.1 ribonuclease R [Synergistota bacterium]MDW8192257.1 ribonuclease R [Synergistota bacterium]
MRDIILNALIKASKPLRPEDLTESKANLKEIKKIIEDLEKEGKVFIDSRGRAILASKLKLLAGRIKVHPRGFAFFKTDSGEEIFIPPSALNGAMNGDKVFIKVRQEKKRGKYGEVVKVIERTKTKLIGRLQIYPAFALLIPDDPSIRDPVLIPKKNLLEGAQDGDKAIVEIVSFPMGSQGIIGKVTKVLGKVGETETEVLSILLSYDIPLEFPEEVEEESKLLKEKIPQEEIRKRLDLRDKIIVTIDGEDARDFDDAISIEIGDDGNYILGVHIADVGYYVKEGSELDKEAFKRGCSVYITDRAIPMLPFKLSNQLCSLVEGEDRLTFSVIIKIDRYGEVINYDIRKSIIKSKARLTYEGVNAFFDGKEIEPYKSLKKELYLMKELALILRNKRISRGALDFNFKETKVILAENGKVKDILSYERGIGEKIIEEFMIVANECIAEFAFYRSLPFIYRIHENPDPEKIRELSDILKLFGYSLKIKGEIKPKHLQNLLKEIKDKPEEKIISTLLLRSLARARYDVENLGHFGLASRCYTHFTSPIRRYPDLAIHRVLAEFLEEGYISPQREKRLSAWLIEAAINSTRRELIADEVEEEEKKFRKCLYMKERLGEIFEGIISGVIPQGIFVELDNGVEGFVPLELMPKDRYIVSEENFMVIGAKAKRVYRIGDKVKVQVIKSDPLTRKIDFLLIE